MFIPEKVEAAFVKRTGTYTNNLGYVVPHIYNAKGECVLKKDKLNSILKWANSQNNGAKNETIENVPRTGFLVNGLVGGVGSGYRYDREEKVRIWHPEGFEFEIVPEQFFEILALKGCQPGSELNGEFVLYWPNENGTGSVQLISVDDPEYTKYYNKIEEAKTKTKEDIVLEKIGDGWDLVTELVVGNVYRLANPKDEYDKKIFYIYLGKQNYYTTKNFYRSSFRNSSVPEIKFMNKHIFISTKYGLKNKPEFVSLTKPQLVTNNTKAYRYDEISTHLIDNNYIGENITKENVLKSFADGKPLLSFINNSTAKHLYFDYSEWELIKENNNTLNYKFVNQYTDYNLSYTSFTYDILKYALTTIHWSKKLEKPERPDLELSKLIDQKPVLEEHIRSFPNNSFMSKLVKTTFGEFLKNKTTDKNVYKYIENNRNSSNNTNKYIDIISDDLFNKMKVTVNPKYKNEINTTIYNSLRLFIEFDLDGKTHKINDFHDLDKIILKHYGLDDNRIDSVIKLVKDKYSGKEAEYIITALENNLTKYTFARKEYDVPQEFYDYKKKLDGIRELGFKLSESSYYYDDHYIYTGNAIDNFLKEVSNIKTTIKYDLNYSPSGMPMFFNILNTHSAKSVYSFIKDIIPHKIVLDTTYIDVNKYFETNSIPVFNIDFNNFNPILETEILEYKNYLQKLDLYEQTNK